MPYYNRDPKRDHNFNNHPVVFPKLLDFSKAFLYAEPSSWQSVVILGLDGINELRAYQEESESYSYTGRRSAVARVRALTHSVTVG